MGSHGWNNVAERQTTTTYPPQGGIVTYHRDSDSDDWVCVHIGPHGSFVRVGHGRIQYDAAVGAGFRHPKSASANQITTQEEKAS